MKKVEIILRNGNPYALTVHPEPLSIFDQWIAGQNGTDGNYYVILIGSNHEDYAVLRENYHDFLKKGKPLEPGETQEINGEISRGMTEEENINYNHGIYDSFHVVDLWGNMRVARFQTDAMYENTDWFTGGIHTYKCVSRTENTVTLSAIYDEIDGLHVIPPETFEIRKDEDGEYVLFYTYHGEENRMYAREI